MAGSVNKVILLGFLGADPEIRVMNSGDKIANLRLATSESWRDKSSGERKEKTEWHRVVIFNEGLAKVAEDYLRKGSKVYIEGQLQTRKWTDQSGQEKFSTEIVLQKYRGELTLLDSKAEGEARGGGEGRHERDDDRRGNDRGGGGGNSYEQRNDSRGGSGGHRQQTQREDFSADLDDEIPFISMTYVW